MGGFVFTRKGAGRRKGKRGRKKLGADRKSKLAKTAKGSSKSFDAARGLDNSRIQEKVRGAIAGNFIASTNTYSGQDSRTSDQSDHSSSVPPYPLVNPLARIRKVDRTDVGNSVSQLVENLINCEKAALTRQYVGMNSYIPIAGRYLKILLCCSFLFLGGERTQLNCLFF